MKTSIFLALITTAAHAQIPGQDPNWPCAQRLVQTLSPGSYWTGPVPAQTGWRDNDVLFPLVTQVVDRDTPEAVSVEKLRAYVATVPEAQRPALFSAIVDQTNDQRTLLIQRLEQLGQRQRNMGDTIAGLGNKIDATPAGDANREMLIGQRDFDVRAFQETQHTMRYACEAPAEMERRVGVFAKVVAGK